MNARGRAAAARGGSCLCGRRGAGRGGRSAARGGGFGTAASRGEVTPSAGEGRGDGGTENGCSLQSRPLAVGRMRLRSDGGLGAGDSGAVGAWGEERLRGGRCHTAALRRAASGDVAVAPSCMLVGGRHHACGSQQHHECSGRGSHGWKGRGPSAVDSTPSGRPQNIPIRASKGMTCPNLREIGSGRGRGFSLVVFPTPLLLV